MKLRKHKETQKKSESQNLTDNTNGTENIIPTKVGIHSQTVEIYNLTGKLIKSFPLGEGGQGD